MPIQYLRRRLRLAGWRAKQFIKYRLLHVDDTPHRIALAVAIAMFVNWTPTSGIQMALVLLLATLLRANKAVGLLVVWLSNPVTIIPILYPNYLLGAWLIPGSQTKTLADWKAMVAGMLNGDLSWVDRMWNFWRFSLDIMLPLWVGSLINGLLIGALSYWLARLAVVRYRRRFGQRRQGDKIDAGEAPEA